jgi:hypothetical protein
VEQQVPPQTTVPQATGHWPDASGQDPSPQQAPPLGQQTPLQVRLLWQHWVGALQSLHFPPVQVWVPLPQEFEQEATRFSSICPLQSLSLPSHTSGEGWGALQALQAPQTPQTPLVQSCCPGPQALLQAFWSPSWQAHPLSMVPSQSLSLPSQVSAFGEPDPWQGPHSVLLNSGPPATATQVCVP